MSRLLSVSHTTRAVRARTKTETRRLGWWKDRNGRQLLKPGDTLTLCEKVMGRRRPCTWCGGEERPGRYACRGCGGLGYVVEPLVRICDVRVTEVRRERLWSITDEGVRAEGLRHDDADFEEWISDSDNPDEIGWPSTTAWVNWFCEAMGCRPDTEITVIRWEYL